MAIVVPDKFNLEDESLPALNTSGVEDFSLEQIDEDTFDVTYADEDVDDIDDTILTQSAHLDNLAPLMSDEDLREIGNDVFEAYQSDLASRSEWEDMTIDGLDNLGLIYEELDEPFEGACSASHPLILENVVKHQSKASNLLLPAAGPARTQILGKATEETEQRAKRVKRHLNYQITTQMTEFYPETEKMFFFQALIGNGFKRNIYDPILDRPANEHLTADRVVVNTLAPSLERAERISVLLYKTQREMFTYFDTDFYLEPENFPDPYVPELSDFESTLREITGLSFLANGQSEVYEVIEQQCYLQLNEVDFSIDPSAPYRPYVVTIEKTTQAVLGIRRDWKEKDEKKLRRNCVTHYPFVPGPGFYALGFVHLLGNLQLTLTLAMRSLVDAGQFANLQGGFKNKLATVSDDYAVAPGEFKDVEFDSDKPLRDAFVEFNYKEPSQILFQLLQYLGVSGQQFADATENIVGESKAYGPVGTTMALLEAGAKFFNSVHKRSFFALTRELESISSLNYEYLDDEISFNVPGDTVVVFREDYNPNNLSVIPHSDPNSPTQAQRISIANNKMSIAQALPDVVNRRQAAKDYFMALDVEDANDYVVEEAKAKEQDPVTDILSAIKGEPIAAFNGQDHNAHIQVKAAWMEDPQGGKNQIMAPYIPVIVANIREHQLMDYMEKLGTLTKQGFTEAQAAQQLQQLGQLAAEQAQRGTPADRIADAEILKAQTNMAKEQREAKESEFDKGVKLLDTLSKVERELNRAAEAGRKGDLEQVKVAKDLILAGLDDVYKDEPQNNNKDDK